MATFKPMLAETCEDMRRVKYPLLVSPKLDGVRCLIKDGVAVARSLKPIPNIHVQALLKGLPDGFDGELICGSPTAPNVFTNTQSIVMSKSKPAVDLRFHIFDDFAHAAPFEKRHKRLVGTVKMWRECETIYPIRHVPHEYVTFSEELLAIEQKAVAEGYEGVMIRSLHGPYKHGRSTVKEGWLLKVKRFSDDEAIVVAVQELMSNQNEKTRDALGYGERSSKKAGLVAANTLGSIEVSWRDTTFSIGTGWDAATRKKLWGERDTLIGKKVKFKYQGVGTDGRPRFPVMLGFRSALDV